ncbi:DUF4307 domain-containing protein [Citricoccus sp. GCM10030269]|uniref:DUF4307 domain-containing protein n=1 Tax=Citricoccus sp. GCM10030269 TaxID=3273388 RepID=UPI003612D77D
MTSTPQSTADRAPDDILANRYGRPQQTGRAEPARWGGRRGRWIAVVALILAVATVVWFTASATAQTLHWKDVGYEITSDSAASVTFQLTKEPEDTVQCAVQVLSEEYAVVGWDTVTIGPETPAQQISPSEKTKYYDVDLRTDALGVNGGVNTCWIPESS